MKTGGKYGLKNEFAIALVVLIFLLSLPKAHAFANTFLEDKTMELHKGEIGDYCIYLQNTGEEDLIQIIRIFEGEEYVENLAEIDKEFNVPIGTVSDDLPVCMKVRLPHDSERGEKYEINYGVTSPSSGEQEGVVSFAPVQIREKFYLAESLEERENDPTILYIAALAVIAAIVVLIIARRYRNGYYYRRIRK